MTDAPKKPGRPSKVEVVAIRKFFTEQGPVVPGGTAKISRDDAKKLQDAGVVKVKL